MLILYYPIDINCNNIDFFVNKEKILDLQNFELEVYPNPVVVLDNGVIVKCNQRFLELLPSRRDNSEQKQFKSLGMFELNQISEELFKKLENKETINDFEVRLWNNSVYFVSASYFNYDGKELAFLAFNKFILPSDYATSPFWTSKNYLQNVLDSFVSFVVVLDCNGVVVLCNKGFEKLLGNTRDKIIGKHLAEVMYSKEEAEFLWKESKKLFDEKKLQIRSQSKLTDSQGEEHSFEITMVLINFEGSSHILCALMDISEVSFLRKLYEEQAASYKTLIENAFDAIYLMKGRHYIYVNPRFCELTGYTFEELTSESFDFNILIPEESKKLLEERYQARLEGREIPNQYELQLLHKSGKRAYVEVSTVSVGKPGEVVVMGIMRDITQRKEYELQLEQSELKLKELNAAKDKLFNIIAHDLRTPISGLISMHKALIENYEVLSPNETHELLIEILDYAIQSSNLLENLLQWSRAQSGTIPFKPELVDIFEVAQASTIINEPNAKKKQISIVNLVPQGSYSLLDRNMITTVFRNLISNAIKFTNPGGRVQIDLKENENDYEIVVSDNGIGMSQEQLEHLFKIGEYVSTVGTANEKGSGLGLILCKEFVEKNQGTLRVESKLGEGSKFIIILPKTTP